MAPRARKARSGRGAVPVLKPSHVLGIAAHAGESSAAILRDGLPLAVSEEERLNGNRGESGFPVRAIRFCLREAQIAGRDLDWAVFAGKPLRRFQRVLATHLQAFPRSARSFSRSMFVWLGDRLWIKNRIVAELGIPPDRVLFASRAEAHAAGAFFPSPFDEAALLVADREGEWAATAVGRARGNELSLEAEIPFPHSLSLFVSAAASFLGFEPENGAERLRALAAHGEPRFEDEVRELLRLDADGAFEIDEGAFRFPFEPERGFGPAFERRLGRPRAPGEPLLWSGTDRRHADLAASVERVVGDALLALAREAHRRTPSEDLCFAGELAGDPSLVARLVAEGPFRRVFVPPALGEGGAALGVALFVHHAVLAGSARWRADHAFLGEPVEADAGADARTFEGESELLGTAADLLAGQKTLGWVRGRAEFGRLALGHRSLLADPRSAETRERVARDLKRREPFRPFGCAVPEERADEWFEIPPGGAHAARFRAVAVRVRDGRRQGIAAVVHADGTAQVQLVRRATDPAFHGLLERFGARTGVPVLLQCSLRARGATTVRGETDALDFFRRTPLDALVVENRLYSKRGSPAATAVT